MKPYFLGIVLFCGVIGIGFSEPKPESDSHVGVEDRKVDLFDDLDNVTNALGDTIYYVNGFLKSVKDKESKDLVTVNLGDVIYSLKELIKSKEPAERISFMGPSLKSMVVKLEKGIKDLPDTKQIISQICSKNGGKKKYHVDLNVKGNFFFAVEYCKKQKMNLLTIDSEEELEEVHKYLKQLSGDQKGRFWSSGTKLGDGKTWKWLTNGKEISHFGWGGSEPNGNGNCLKLFINYYSSGFYDDIECSNIYSPVCVSI